MKLLDSKTSALKSCLYIGTFICLVGLLAFASKSNIFKYIARTSFEVENSGSSCRPVSDVSSQFCEESRGSDVHRIIAASTGTDPTLLSLSFHEKKSISAEKIGWIPNVVHYVWFGKITFTFVHYLSFFSVKKFINPDYIFIHGDSKIEGSWWNRTIKDVPNIFHVQTDCPSVAPNGKKFKWIQHISDYVRVKTVLAFGGIYLDNDILVLRSFDPIRNNQVVYPRENKEKIQPAVLLGKRGTPFLRMALELYRSYRGDQESWVRIGLECPSNLAEMYPHLIYVEEKHSQFPGPEDLFERHYNWTSDYVVHLWRNRYKVPSGPEDIKKLDTAFGEITRYIYYGSEKII